MRGRIRHKLRATRVHKDQRRKIMEDILDQEIDGERVIDMTDGPFIPDEAWWEEEMLEPPPDEDEVVNDGEEPADSD